MCKIVVDKWFLLLYNTYIQTQQEHEMTTEEDTFEASQLRIVIREYGAKLYYNHENQLHRIYGPAVIESSGYKAWYLNGKRHRTDGPASEYADGFKDWYISGECITEAEFLAHPLCTVSKSC